MLKIWIKQLLDKKYIDNGNIRLEIFNRAGAKLIKLALKHIKSKLHKNLILEYLK